MFPVTRQVRRKRTPFSARPGRIRGSADESEESGGERRSVHTEVGSGKKQRGLGEEARLGSGERKAGLGATMRSPDKPTHRWPPDGQAAPSGTRPTLLPRGPIPPDPPLGRRIPGPGNQRCDPAGPAAVAECRGRSAGTPLLHGVRITRELRRARTSARLRTPRRCWREYARAH